MGQRYVQLDSTYTGFLNNSGILHVSQIPPNPAILVPGPALLFVLVNGVPSVGVQVMIGSGHVGKQAISSIGPLPSSIMEPVTSTIASSGANNPVTTQVSVGSRVSGQDAHAWLLLIGILVALLQ